MSQLFLLPLSSLKDDQFPVLVANLQALENLLNGHLDESNVAPGSLTGLSVADHSLTLVKIAAGELQWTVDVPLVTNSSAVAADSTGAKAFVGSTQVLAAEAIKHLKSAQLIVDYTWAVTAHGTIQLYDATAAAVRGESLAKVGGESSEWEAFVVSGLAAGNTLQVRANITDAGQAGDAVTLFKAILRLTLGVS